NYAVDISKGNLPLSVALTSISTIAAILLTPITFHFWSQFYPETNNLMQAIYVNPLNMIVAVFIIIGAPIIIGSWLNANHPHIVKKW
ncbi:MAG TPA: bile acid:sodium symporter family protein, partial [Methanosarcinales archaeon]|nr:bile acid:sodium symporter family protein [Methanosarcinales archaeon]